MALFKFTTAWLNDANNVAFRGATKRAAWYVAPIDGTDMETDGTVVAAAADTSASHAGWTELTNYDEATRPQWSPTQADDTILANTTMMTLTATTNMTIGGYALFSSSTKSETASMLMGAKIYDSPVKILAGETGKIPIRLDIEQSLVFVSGEDAAEDPSNITADEFQF